MDRIAVSALGVIFLLIAVIARPYRNVPAGFEFCPDTKFRSVTGIIMAVSLYIIKLTKEIDEGNRASYDKLKALAKTDPDARRVLKTVKEPPKPITQGIKVAPVKKPDTFEQTVQKAGSGDAASIALLRKKADYEDIKAQHSLGIMLMDSDPDESFKWLEKSSKLAESQEAIRRLAAKGNAKAQAWVDKQKDPAPATVRGKTCAPTGPKTDDLGYIRPPTKHTKPKIGEVYRINDALLQTGQKNTMVLIKEMKGDFVTTWTVTREPGKHKCAKLMEPWLAGFPTSSVYVLTDIERTYKKNMLAEYRGTLGSADIKQFRLSA